MATNGLKILFGGIMSSYLLFTETGIYLKILGIALLIFLSLYASNTDMLIEELKKEVEE